MTLLKAECLDCEHMTAVEGKAPEYCGNCGTKLFAGDLE